MFFGRSSGHPPSIQDQLDDMMLSMMLSMMLLVCIFFVIPFLIVVIRRKNVLGILSAILVLASFGYGMYLMVKPSDEFDRNSVAIGYITGINRHPLDGCEVLVDEAPEYVKIENDSSCNFDVGQQITYTISKENPYLIYRVR